MLVDDAGPGGKVPRGCELQFANPDAVNDVFHLIEVHRGLPTLTVRMNTRPSLLRHSALAALLLALPFAAASTPEPQPAYALSAIVQQEPGGARGIRVNGTNASPTLDDASYRTAIGAARLLYSSEGPALRAVLTARNRLGLKTPVIVYLGGFTTNGDDVLALERDYRSGIAMTRVATLAVDLAANATELGLKDPLEGELAIKASTAAASDIKDSSKFCFWLRLDEELLQVTAVDAASGRVAVVRGFAGTTPAAHRAGTPTLSPVYLGSRNDLGAARHSNSWPGGPDYLRYALDPRQPAAAKFKGGLVARVMQEGYDGAWLDTFQPAPYNLCDALGRKVKYFWDSTSGQAYDFDSYLDAIKTYLRGIRATVRAATGREPVLYANSATASYAKGLKVLFNHGDTRDLLDGYCFEDSYLKVQAQREKGRSTAVRAAFGPVTGEKWLTNVVNHADAARSGLSGICMVGPAGYLAAYFNPSQPNYAQLLRFAYGSHLLTVTAARATSLGLTLLITPSGAAAWPPMLYAPLGDPTQPNDIAALKLRDSACYARSFAHGWVAVNPSAGGQPVTVTAPAGCVDAITRQPVSSVTLAPADAVVLLRADAR